jgi:hypothetical protein
MKALTVEQMMAADDIQYAEVPAFGGVVRIGSIDAGQMIDFVESNEGPAKRTAGLRLIIQSLVDDDGNRIGDMKDLERWKRRSQKTCNALVAEILKLNGLDDAAKKVLGNDSGEALGGASPTS